MRRRFGDRSDGRRLRTLDPMFTLIPYIMRTRLDSQNLFEFDIPLEHMEEYLHHKREEGYKKMSFLYVAMAAMIRMYSQKPMLNRFVAGNRIYARNRIEISITDKKQMTEKALETTVKIAFDPKSTIYDVYQKVNKIIEENKGEDTENDSDVTARILTLLPSFLIRALMGLLRFLDRHGVMPKALIAVSPFHTGTFITDLGSLGIQPVYHHLYEFGTTTIFIAFGAKYKKITLDENGQKDRGKYLNFKVSTDERICDGYAYATGFKLMQNLLLHPERLDKPPVQVFEDIE
jgi:hypothetical protein